MHAAAFAPANISLVFETYEAEPPHDRGSMGVGITLQKGATVQVSRRPPPSDTLILVHGEPWEFPTVRTVVEEMTGVPLLIEITAAWPFGCGFGMSGASALAAAFAIDRLLDLRHSREVLGMIAHRAEVKNATGLGDVGGQCNGGIMVKTRKHEPLTVEHLDLPPQTLHCRVFGPILTSEVINSREKLRDINAAGHAALETIKAERPVLDMRRLFAISHRFAADSGLLRPRVRQAIAEAESAGHAATMIMLGEAVVSTGPFPGSEPAEILFGGVRVL